MQKLIKTKVRVSINDLAWQTLKIYFVLIAAQSQLLLQCTVENLVKVKSGQLLCRIEYNIIWYLHLHYFYFHITSIFLCIYYQNMDEISIFLIYFLKICFVRKSKRLLWTHFFAPWSPRKHYKLAQNIKPKVTFKFWNLFWNPHKICYHLIL